MGTMTTPYTEKNFNAMLDKLSEVMAQRNAAMILAKAAVDGADRMEMQEAYELLKTEISKKNDNNTSQP
jgi:hypothetical protein